MSENEEILVVAPKHQVGDGDHDDHDPHFEPIISLPEVSLPTLEEEEIEMIKLRAKLYRYDTSECPSEWKERGTGDVKLLRHKENNSVRVLMRRDKTLKICANHFVTPYMELKPNCGSDRAWVWSVIADFADETAKSELLAIRFANADNAKKWKDTFEEAKQLVATKCRIFTRSLNDESDEEEDDSRSGDSNESSDESNVNGNSIDSSATKTEANTAAENLEKLNINKDEVTAEDSDSVNLKVITNEDVKNKEESEKTNSAAKLIS